MTSHWIILSKREVEHALRVIDGLHVDDALSVCLLQRVAVERVFGQHATKAVSKRRVERNRVDGQQTNNYGRDDGRYPNFVPQETLAHYRPRIPHPGAGRRRKRSASVTAPTTTSAVLTPVAPMRTIDDTPNLAAYLSSTGRS